MPPEVVDQIPGWVDALRDIGLIGWLILSILALVFGWVLSKAAHERAMAQATRELQERLDYIEARRVEERAGRIAAERRVSELTERWDRALGIMANIERELIRAVSRGDR